MLPLRCLLVSMVACAAGAVAEAQADLETFLDGPASQPAQSKPLPPGSRVLWAPPADVTDCAWSSGGRQIVCLCRQQSDAVSPNATQLAFRYVLQDTNADQRVDWRDGSSLLLKSLP